MTKRTWPRTRYWTFCIAACFLTSQAFVEGQEVHLEKTSSRAVSRLRRFFSGIESEPILDRVEATDARWWSVHLRSRRSGTASTTPGFNRFAAARGGDPLRDGGVRRAQATPPTPDPSGGAPTEPVDLNVPAADRAIGGGEPTTADAADAGSPSGGDGGAPTEPVDLNVPAAVRSLGGGAPTEEAAETKAAATEEKVKRLQDLLGFEDSPVNIYGWIENSYTYNANGRSANGQNFGVNPNNQANSWQGNQYYIVVENPIEHEGKINFGFRVDSIFGNDWQFNYMQGLFNNAFKLNSFAGYDLAQLYGEVHLPFLTKGGIDVKGGRWYTIAGYEQVPAIARPLLSVPYMFNYGPFTHVGVLTTTHVSDRVNLYNGAINGWDRWINERYLWGYIGGISWTSKDEKTTLAFTSIWGPNQFPNQLPGNQQIYPTGYVNVPSIAGLPNPGYFRNSRTFFTTVGTHKWNDKLTQVMETDQGFERSIPGLGSGGKNGQPRDATWFSFGNWFLYELHPKITGVWRSEVYWDPQGARTQNIVNGQFVGDRYYEITLGAIYKPNPNVWIRPEIREDWSQYHKAYSNDTRKSQFTLAFDVILLW